MREVNEPSVAIWAQEGSVLTFGEEISRAVDPRKIRTTLGQTVCKTFVGIGGDVGSHTIIIVGSGNVGGGA